MGLDGHHTEELQGLKEMADGITTGSIVVDMINKNGKEAGAPIQEYVEKLKISIKGWKNFEKEIGSDILQEISSFLELIG